MDNRSRRGSVSSRASPRSGDSRRHGNDTSRSSNDPGNSNSWEASRGKSAFNGDRGKQDMGSPRDERERRRNDDGGNRIPPPMHRADSEDGELEEFGSGSSGYGAAGLQTRDVPGEGQRHEEAVRSRREEGGREAETRHDRQRRSDSGTDLSVRMEDSEDEMEVSTRSESASKPSAPAPQPKVDKLSAMRAKLLEKRRQLQKKKKNVGSAPTEAKAPPSQARNKPNNAQNQSRNHASGNEKRNQNHSPRRSPSGGTKRKANTFISPGHGGRKTAKTNGNTKASSARKNTSKTSVPVLKKPLSGPLRSTTKGVCWRKTEKDMRNSTVCFKSILRAAMHGQTANSKGVMDAQLKNLDKAKNWESEYVPFVSSVLIALAKDHQNAVGIAEEGVRAAHECFTFIRDGEEQPLLQAMDR